MKSATQKWTYRRWLRLCVWLVGHHILSWPFAFIAAGSIYHVHRDLHMDMTEWWVWSVVGLASSVLALVLKVFEERTTQRARNREAKIIFRAVKANRKPIFFLYLRPFLLTDKMRLMNPRSSGILFLPTSYSEEDVLDFETNLERTLRKSGPLIALGQPGELTGAGRLAVPETKWKERFKILASAAVQVFVIPSHTQGTRWEITWLQERGLFSKCVFIMPPEPFSKLDMRNFWGQAASSMQELDMQIPPYSEMGMVFRLDSSGGVQDLVFISPDSSLDSTLKRFRSTISTQRHV